MPFTMVAKVALIRERLGHPMQAEISDNSIQDAIRSAMKEYASYRPMKVVVPLPVVEGTSVYPLPEGVLGVSDCVLAITGEVGADEFTEAQPSSSFDMASRIVDKNALYKGYEWRLIYTSDGLPAVKIIPTPRESFTTEMVLTKEFTEENFPLIDEELMLGRATALAMQALANFRGKIMSVPTGVGFKMALDGGQMLLKQAKELNERWEKRTKAGSRVTAG